MSSKSNLGGRSVLITGANRGLGRALMEEALARGATTVYAAARRPIDHPDERVVPVHLDLADGTTIEEAASRIESLDVLINNAGIGTVGESLADAALLQQRLQVNAVGPATLTALLAPALRSQHGHVINIGSLAGIANLPVMPAYSISKAAALSLTQAQRALLRSDAIQVHLVLAGPIDTDMSRDLEIPKSTPEAVASEIFDALERGELDIFPDPMSADLAEAWATSLGKTLETANAALLPTPDYTTTFETSASAADCFAAVSDPGRWWDGEVIGSADALGAEFTYSHGGMHRSVHRVTEYVPNKRVAWLVTDSQLGFVNEDQPWTGTTIVFDLEEVEGQTRVTMTHLGLSPDKDCFDQCSFGWDHVIGRSLRQFIATGELVRF